MSLVTIDPSLSCTAVVIDDKRCVFVNKKLAETKNGKLTKWFKLASPYINYIMLDYDENLEDYSANEINKLRQYDEITTTIIDTILLNINPTNDIRVAIEGYSFNSVPTSIIDLVTFNTLLRKKIYDITEYIEVLSPKTLKLEAAKLTYSPIKTGKKVIKYEYRNHEGISGGAFTKTQMYQAIIDNESIQDPWKYFLIEHKKEALNYKNIPKPLEDVNDAVIMHYAILKQAFDK